mmetsp:Transcript_29627/g.87970  ORF Transcript_29627/g.87970 Transcript_29627/m.87970 type:complete len:287 (+) Transcript_29627:280-1140(+)
MDRERLWARPLLESIGRTGASATRPKRLSDSSSSLRRISSSLSAFCLLCASFSSSSSRFLSFRLLSFWACVSFSARRVVHSSVTVDQPPPPSSCFGRDFSTWRDFSTTWKGFCVTTGAGAARGSSGFFSFSFSSSSASSSPTSSSASPATSPARSPPLLLRNVRRATMGHSFEFRYRCCLSEKTFMPSWRAVWSLRTTFSARPDTNFLLVTMSNRSVEVAFRSPTILMALVSHFSRASGFSEIAILSSTWTSSGSSSCGFLFGTTCRREITSPGMRRCSGLQSPSS